MDKYLEAIGQEEELLNSLLDKKDKLISSNKDKSSTLKSYGVKEERLKQKQGYNLKRKKYLENKGQYIRYFFKKALIFSLKSSIGFWVVIGFILLMSKLMNDVLNPSLVEIICSNFTISALFGSVEYFNVSRDFRKTIGGYNGDIDNDISLNSKDLDTLQSEKEKLQESMNENNQLLDELESTIAVIREKILNYRTCRNNLIESLISDLDAHIVDFEYQTSDISKVLEKQIH